MSVAKDQETTPLVDANQQVQSQQTQAIVFPPGDLYSDEPQLETYLHLRQIILLMTCLDWLWRDRSDYFAAGNLTIYYSPRQRKSEDFRGPDFFVVLNTQHYPRKSWVVWEEDGKYPNVIIELLSESTEKVDRGLKKQIYQDTFRTLDYFWFDPDGLEFAGFHLVDGKYLPLEPNEQGWLWSEQLQLFLGVQDDKLRFFSRDGQLIPTPQESAELEEQQRREAERQRQEAERQKQEAEQQRQEAERQRQEAERQKQEAEALLARYRAQFGDLEA